MSKEIKHFGVVESISHDKIKVRILQASACSSCSAAQLCKSSESKEKIIDVNCANPQSLSIGQTVTLTGSVQQGLKATFWAYILPLLLLLIVLIASKYITGNDGIAAICSIAIVALYFIVLYFFKSKFENKFSFKITNI